MLPTIDLSNIIRKIVLAAGWVVINPIGRTVALATVVTATTLTALNLLVPIPKLENLVQAVYFSDADGNFKQWIFYSFALDSAALMLDSLVLFVVNLVAFTLSATVAMIAAMWAFKSKKVVAEAYGKILHH